MANSDTPEQPAQPQHSQGFVGGVPRSEATSGQQPHLYPGALEQAYTQQPYSYPHPYPTQSPWPMPEQAGYPPYAANVATPPPVAGPPEGGGRRNAAILGGVGVIVILVVVLVVVLSNSHQSRSGGGSGSGGSAWSRASLGADVVGTWVNGDDIIVATTNTLTAYQAASGTQDWRKALPSGDTICSMSQSASSPLGAFVYGSGQTCGSLEIVNLSTGETTSPSPVSLLDANGEGTYGSGTVPSVQGSYLAAPYGQSGIVDIDLSTGRAVWNTDQSALAGNNEAGCVIDSAVVVGSDIYTSEADCASGGSSQVWAYSAASAKPPIAMNLPATCAEPGLLQAASDLLVVCNEGQNDAGLLLLTPGTSSFTALKVAHPDSVGIADDAHGIPAGQATLSGMAISGTTLYIPDWSNGMDSIDALTAVSLSNGSTLWTSSLASSDNEPRLLGATDAGALLDYSTDSGTSAITTLAASSGAAAPGRTFDPTDLADADTDVLVDGYLIGIADKSPSEGDQLAAVNVG